MSANELSAYLVSLSDNNVSHESRKIDLNHAQGGPFEKLICTQVRAVATTVPRMNVAGLTWKAFGSFSNKIICGQNPSRTRTKNMCL